MEQIRQTVALPRRYYSFIVMIWTLALGLAAVVLYILFPPAERSIMGACVAADAHRPAEAWRYLRFQVKMELCQPYLESMAEGEYEAVFLAMYSLEAYEMESFRKYRGLDTLKIEPVLENSMELLGILEQMLSDDMSVERVYLGIDPVKMERHLSWEDELDWQQTIGALMQKHEEVTWEVLLAYPSFTEWQLLSKEERKRGIEGYERAMNVITSQENTLLFFIGGQEWLICNQENYQGNGTLNASIADRVMLNVFCDQHYRVTADNQREMIKELEETLYNWQSEPLYVRRREGEMLVFLGDSIFGNFTDSSSVPGVVEYFTGACCINCGYGGICLSAGSGDVVGVDVIGNLCNGGTGDIPEGTPAYRGIQSFLQSNMESRRIVFLLNYGINDYLVGNPVETEDKYEITTYAGAMRTGIELLQAAFPNAEIVVMSPSYITYWDEGTRIGSETGSVLTEYVDTAVRVAREYGLYYINVYEHMKSCAEEELLTADGVHPNESGRFYLGRLICGKLNEIK